MKATVRKEFIDRHTDALHRIGEVIEVSEERIAEIKKVDAGLIEVVEGDTIPPQTEEIEEIEEKVDAPEPPKKSGRKGRKKGEQ